VSRVKPAEEGNGPVWLNGNPVAPRHQPSACFPISSLIEDDFQRDIRYHFHAFSTLNPAVSTIQSHKPLIPSPTPYVHPISPKVTQSHPRIGRGMQSISNASISVFKERAFLSIAFYSLVSRASDAIPGAGILQVLPQTRARIDACDAAKRRDWSTWLCLVRLL
jgi:hypothetical protein